MYQSQAKSLRGFAERIESLESEKAGLQEDVKDLYEQVKGAGFKPKVLKAALKARKHSASERKAEQDEIDLYLAAIDDQMDLFVSDPGSSIESVTITTPGAEPVTIKGGLRRRGQTAATAH